MTYFLHTFHIKSLPVPQKGITLPLFGRLLIWNFDGKWDLSSLFMSNSNTGLHLKTCSIWMSLFILKSYFPFPRWSRMHHCVYLSAAVLSHFIFVMSQCSQISAISLVRTMLMLLIEMMDKSTKIRLSSPRHIFTWVTTTHCSYTAYGGCVWGPLSTVDINYLSIIVNSCVFLCLI